LDRSGKSLGKAVVKYRSRRDTERAIKEFNRAELDKRILTVEPDT
jgi:RNA recognition motif-containing protein